MLRRSGSVPQNIGYVLYGNKTFSVGSYYDAKEGKTIQAVKITATDDPKAIVSRNKNIFARQNTPIKNVKIISSYQALIDNQYVAEINSELVTDLMINSKITKGVVKDPLIWCKVGSKLQLVRVGSSLHKEVLNAEYRKKLKKIKSRQFEIGGVYSTPAGKTAVYLGNVDAHVGIVDYKNASDVKTVFMKNQRLFYYLNSNLDEIDVDSINKWSLMFKANHSFVEKTKNIKVDADIISQIRESFTKKFKQYLVNWSQNQSKSNNSYVSNSVYWEYRYVCGFMSMVNSGDPPVQKIDLQKYLMLS